jgi:hypothetical protein
LKWHAGTIADLGPSLGIARGTDAHRRAPTETQEVCQPPTAATPSRVALYAI